MDVRLLPRLLANHRRLREHDRWSRSQLLAHQARELERLRAHALARSRFYRRFHQGLARAPLDELPVLTKATLMGCFDEVVTDPALHLGRVLSIM